MSVLYPLTLKSYYTQYKPGIRNLTKSFFLVLIGAASFQSVSAQDEKQVPRNKEGAAVETRLKANPTPGSRSERLQSKSQLTAQEKKIATGKAEEEKARQEAAKKLLDQRTPSLPGVEYKVVTSGAIVEYVITNARTEIFRQQINIGGSVYDKQVQAEKEAIYAAKSFRRNLQHPVDLLMAEINHLSQQKNTSSVNRISNAQRTTADYTFNGAGGTITVSGPASPYPATITVSGVPAGATVKSVTINGIDHTYPDDVDIVLQSPLGTNVILMSDCGFFDNLVDVNYTFSDDAAVGLLDDDISPSGTYRPTNFGTGDDWPAPGPLTAPSAVTLSTFGNGDHNGTWNLFIVDDVGGDEGVWDSWSITFTDPPLVCFPVVITGQPSNLTICSAETGSFTAVGGPNDVSYNWQVNTGSGFAYITNGGVYSGANTGTLTITSPDPSMSGYQYRVVVTCSGGGLPEISNPATLTVNASPPAPGIIPGAPAICPGGSVALNVAIMQSSSGTITIPTTANPATPYPSTITASGIPAGSTVKQVILYNFSHTWPADVDIVLQSPTGTNVILLSDRGGSTPTNSTLTFDDAAAALVSNTAIVSGTFRPTNTAGPDAWPAPGPASFTQVNPTLATFGSGDHNGAWKLFVNDQASGDGGSIIGWAIIFNAPPGSNAAVFSPVTGLFTDAGLTTAYTGTAVPAVYAAPSSTTTYTAITNNGTCNSLTTDVTVTVNEFTAITTQPTSGSTCVGAPTTFSVEATGSTLTYKWQVDPNTGTFTNIDAANNPSGFIYSGETTATLSINTVMATMNNYKFRCIVSGACPPTLTSDVVTLTINSLPVISITQSNQCAPTELTATGADTYSWSPADGLSATTGSTVTANPIGNTAYTVTGIDANGCANSAQANVNYTPAMPDVSPAAPVICQGTIQALSVAAPPPGVTASSGPISVSIPDGDPTIGADHALTVSGFVGTVQSISVTFNITHTWDSDLDINLVAPNGNILSLVVARGGSGDNFINTTISSASSTSLGTGTAPFTGTFAADGLTGWGPFTYPSNVSSFASLFSVPNGTWRLAMADWGGGDLGTLTSWSITINAVPPPTAGVWSPVSGLFSDAAGTIPYVAGTPTATVYANPASTTTYSVTLTNASVETRTFASGGPITIPGVAPGSSSAGAGAPYHSPLTIAGLPANATVKSVTIRGIRHSFPDDIDILLQSPTGTNVVLMSDAGGGAFLEGESYTFDDASSLSLATSAYNPTGIYKPTNFTSPDAFPAPIGSITQGVNPTLSSFTGDLNGEWKLFVADDVGGDVGMITSWEITFAVAQANCVSAPRTVTVTVHNAVTVTTQPQNRTACQNGSVTFTAAGTGTIQTTQWQVSTNGGTTWTDIAGANTTTLTLTNVQPSQNGYRYRLVFSSAGCGSVNSASATLTVNPLPTVSLGLSPAGQTDLRPGMVTTVTANSSPAGASYQWFLNGVSQPSITGSSYGVDAYHLGTYTVRVTDVNGCVNTTAGVTFKAMPTSNVFVYPNPTQGNYFVSYYVPHPNTLIYITVIDMNGKRIEERQAVTTGPYTRFDFSAGKLSAGVYIIQFHNSQKKLLDEARLVVTR